MNALTINSQAINTHNGLYSLNDLHRASGNENRHRPTFFMANQETKAIIAEIESENTIAYHTVKGNRADGTKQGTFVCRELVYRYAMWISAKFSLMVIRAFDALGTGAIPCLGASTTTDRKPLVQAVNMLCRETGAIYSNVWKMIHQRFDVECVDELTCEQVNQAIEYIHGLMLAHGKPTDHQALYGVLADSAVHLRDYARILHSMRHLPFMDEQMGRSMYEHINETYGDIVRLSQSMGLTNSRGRAMFESNCINYYHGNALIFN